MTETTATIQTLLVRDAAGAERAVAVGPAPITIGRDAACTIPLVRLGGGRPSGAGRPRLSGDRERPVPHSEPPRLGDARPGI